jgi:PEGA domain-containing protein
LELLQKAQLEFPGDSELEEMQKLAQAALERADQAQRLMTEGQELCAQHRFEEGLKLLETAFHMDEHNPVTRSVLCNALLEQARSLVDTNWKAAEDLTLRALDLNPAHPQAKSMRTLVQDRKREQFVNECVSQARRLQAAADVAAALAKVEDGLLPYPGESRLVQMHEILQREMAQTQHRQERRNDLDDIRRLQRDAEAASDPSLTANFGRRAQTLAGKYPHDDEFESIAREAAARTAIFGVHPPGSQGQPQAPNAGGATMLFSPGAGVQDRPAAPPLSSGAKPAPARGTKATSPSSRPTASQPAKPEAEKGPPVWAGAVASIRGFTKRLSLPRVNLRAVAELPLLKSPLLKSPLLKSPKVLGAAGGVFVFVVIAALVIPRIIHPKPAHPLVMVPVHVRTVPPGAAILINDEVRGSSEVDLQLAPGTYTVTTQMDGYQAATSALEVRAGSPVSLDITILPTPLTFRMTTDVAGGKAWLDDQPAGDVNEGQLTLSNLTPGPHKLRFFKDKQGASFAFEVAQGALPIVGEKISTTGLHVVVVSAMGHSLKVYNSFGKAQLSIDGQSAVELGPSGVELQGIAHGPHQLLVTQGSDHHAVDVDLGPAPSLSAFLQSDQDIGTLLVLTGEDKVKVFLDGKLQKRTTEGGQLRIANLEPRQYGVRVAKDGFQDVGEQKIEVRKAEQARLKFVMVAMARLAMLVGQGGIPGTQVFLDHAAIGTVQAEGSFHYSAVSPGDHLIELRKEHYKPRQIQKRFSSSATIALGPAEMMLEALPGELHITFSPPDADVTLTGNGQPLAHLKNGTTMTLPGGSYSLTARTPDGLVRSSVVQVVSGETRSFDLALAPGGMRDWEQPESWTQEKDVYVHRGGNFVLFRTSPTTGTFSFSALLQKGHRLQWVFRYVDDKNYLLYSMDENFFYRALVRNGQPTETAQYPHKTDKKQFRTLQIRVSGNEIVHEIREGNSWVNLDTWSQPGADLSAGKFGFYITGKDQVALSNFRHYAELKAH